MRQGYGPLRSDRTRLRARALPPADPLARGFRRARAMRRAGRRAEARRITRSEESKFAGGKGPIRPQLIVRPRGSRRVEAGGSHEAKNLSLLEAKELSGAR